MDGGEEKQTTEEEGRNLLGPPTFVELENGRPKCVETGHELLPSDKDMYSNSERCRLGLIDFAVPLNMFKPDPLNRCVDWRVKEDIALMSSWCFANEDNIRGKNQRGASLWTRANNLFNEARLKNPEEIGERNVESMKGRWKRLNKSANKWIAAYKEAYGRKRSGMSLEDVELEAQAIYEVGGNKFNNLLVFKEVMSKHPKWELKLDHDSTHFHPENEENNDESGDISKRSRTNEDGEYSIPSHQETPISGSSTIPNPTGGDATTKEKGKGVTSQSSSTNEVVTEIRAFRLTRNREVEIMSQLGRDRIELELKKEQRKAMKMNQVLLNTLLTKNHLSPEDEKIKRYLMSVVFGK